MHPILFHVSGIPVYTYGVSYMANVVLVYFLVTSRAPTHGFPAREAGISCALGGLGVFVGGYLLYRLHQLVLGAPAVLAGQYFLGGMALGIAAIWIYPKMKGLQPLHFSDIGLTYTIIGVAIHRTTGCFMGGCCFGIPTSLPWGVIFPSGSPAALAFGTGTPVHPTQIYESIFLLTLFIACYVWLNHRRHHHGEVTALFIIGYTLFRFFTEWLRADALTMSRIFHLTFNQWASLVMLVIGLLLMAWSMCYGTEAKITRERA